MQIKSIFVLFIITLTTISVLHAKEFLTENQKNVILKEIDNICGDTWCEGDYDYSFNTFSCDDITNKCVMEFDVIASADEEYNEEGVIYPTRCTINEMSSYDQMIKTSSSGMTRLVDEFYTKVSDCVDEGEEAAF